MDSSESINKPEGRNKCKGACLLILFPFLMLLVVVGTIVTAALGAFGGFFTAPCVVYLAVAYPGGRGESPFQIKMIALLLIIVLLPLVMVVGFFGGIFVAEVHYFREYVCTLCVEPMCESIK